MSPQKDKNIRQTNNSVDFHLLMIKKIDKLIKEHEKKPSKDSDEEDLLHHTSPPSSIEMRESLSKQMKLSEVPLDPKPDRLVPPQKTIPEEFKTDIFVTTSPEFKYVSSLDNEDKIIMFQDITKRRVEVVDLQSFMKKDVSSSNKRRPTRNRIKNSRVEIITTKEPTSKEATLILKSATPSSKKSDEKAKLYYLNSKKGKKSDKSDVENMYVRMDFEQKLQEIKQKEEEEQGKKRELEQKEEEEKQKEVQKQKEIQQRELEKKKEKEQREKEKMKKEVQKQKEIQQRELEKKKEKEQREKEKMKKEAQRQKEIQQRELEKKKQKEQLEKEKMKKEAQRQKEIQQRELEKEKKEELKKKEKELLERERELKKLEEQKQKEIKPEPIDEDISPLISIDLDEDDTKKPVLSIPRVRVADKQGRKSIKEAKEQPNVKSTSLEQNNAIQKEAKLQMKESEKQHQIEEKKLKEEQKMAAKEQKRKELEEKKTKKLEAKKARAEEKQKQKEQKKKELEEIKLEKTKNKVTEEKKPLIKKEKTKKEESEASTFLDEDVIKVLLIADDLLSELPEEIIDKFANSKDFELYEKVMSKYKPK